MSALHIMASSSSQIKYDVFISFRGLNTRGGFLSHLLKALREKQIDAYVDDRLKEGDDLLPTLFTAIEKSQIALVIFSSDYASSKWCLEELVKITECMTENWQIVIPIFYNIDPSDVRRQKGCYQNAFVHHEKCFKDNIMTVEKWKLSLKRVANLSGFHSINFGTEAELIEKVVQRVLARLNYMPQIEFKGLIGIDKPIEELQSMMSCTASKDVHIIGIWGMGGIGKTTIASALFNILCSEFEGCCFVPNVREQSEKNGIIQLRDKLLSILLEEKDLNIGANGVPSHVLRRLGRKKILVVLDDVNNPDHVQSLVGGHEWLGQGSRIFITTRDKHVICKEADDIYEVGALEHHEALQLLNLHAFNGRSLQMSQHNLMTKVVDYAQGIPLALKVLGTFLFGKSAEEWESQLQKLEKMSFNEIQNVLRLSYEGLDREESNIFLYIACFFKGDDNIKILLDACGYSTAIALKTLHDRALIIVSKDGKHVTMHDLIREMGREIVRRQNIEKFGERSHLWDPIDITQVLKQDQGTDRIESITFNMSSAPDLRLNRHSLAKMKNLNFLRFYSYDTYGVHLPEGLEKLPDKLKLFHWDDYPLESLPTKFNAENLVELDMQGSYVKKLWNDIQNLANLRRIDLDGSKQLIELPDLSKASNLETLSLCDCENLRSVHPSIFFLQKLIHVDLERCIRLKKLAGKCSSSSKVEHLNLSGCKRLKHLPDSTSKLKFLKELYLEGCQQLDTSNLHILFSGLSSLERLNLGGCHNLDKLPDNVNNLSLLCWLSVKGTNVKSLPESIKHLRKLRYLYLGSCRRLQSLPELPPSIQYLEVSDCTSLKTVFTPTPKMLKQHVKLFKKQISEDDFRRYESGPDYFNTYFSFENCPSLDRNALRVLLIYLGHYNKEKRAVMEKRIEKRRASS
ncbi:disease resistance-like protein DSC1 [Arachis duranensis]|uniref:Disease resistance-like protein DSC1 n=1 Tax=Arachis duranensis TaxID=130453 RepID=A0A6P5N191_ARADU|nr:disease resistance-like protein DSC1 [Arachis duranensis]XP_052113303.1 disease resistance-like protein DSC1 [Arachis duranensis]XP_052113304.1 disease resistance-like protein DSC1 [Arachis duranensis]XP_052113305.1 disease resistance-like protein DSC1 [Arachis duranensis]XP_052113306.1 disease resistance-like protein DSC1 [Arachis duranensis]XP_052113308.1 disease resistance-like protein DSC1 [Arachis duranensis]XP_052113309.1 disease resistance-like protein DSC1 [Arachis duranensis]XP_0